MPVWIDIFAPVDKKTIWLTLSQLAVPLGIVLGYGSTAVLVSNLNWRWSFIIQAFAFVPISLLFIFYPTKYFKSQQVHRSELVEIRRSLTRSWDNDIFQQEGETGVPKCSNFRPRRSSFYESLSQYQGLKELLKNKVYLFLTLSASSLYFVITGMQFWITDYMIIILKIPPSEVFITFAVL